MSTELLCVVPEGTTQKTRGFFRNQLDRWSEDESCRGNVGPAPYVCHTVGNVREHHSAPSGYPPFSPDSPVLPSHVDNLVGRQWAATLQEAERIASELLRTAFLADALCHVGLRAGGCVRHAALGGGIVSQRIGRAGDFSDRSLS